VLWDLFNYRYEGPLDKDGPSLTYLKTLITNLPEKLGSYLNGCIEFLFFDRRLNKTLKRNHCFGNLILAAAIFREHGASDGSTITQSDIHRAIGDGLSTLAEHIGAGEHSVMPCTSTPAQLRIRYTNGVEIPGEHKLNDARRGFPVDSAKVDYCGKVRVYEEVLEQIAEAEIIVLAPGSLYSSIIPVFRVPGIAEAVRKNVKALKILVSNIWVQTGETDLSISDPDRKFHVSDMIEAYRENIPGGIDGLFNEVLAVSLKDVPASILQRYAVEGKVPIYLDRDNLKSRNLHPVECEIYSKAAVSARGVIQHDQDNLAITIKTLYNGRYGFEVAKTALHTKARERDQELVYTECNISCIKPCEKSRVISAKLDSTEIHFIGAKGENTESDIKQRIEAILWDHPVIPVSHLDYFTNIHCIQPELWGRDQKWDNVFSFFDPKDRCIKIRTDQVDSRYGLELALLIAIGESLLGDYAVTKTMLPVNIQGVDLGRVYHLFLQPSKERNCYFSQKELEEFLFLSRMCNTDDANHYTRLINKGEGFTPPGLLMGLMYAWYVDNRLASHIEYKMSLMKIRRTDLIPEQLRMAERRSRMIDFLREVAFRS
jgi:uncharacterized cofD-like protein